MLSRHEKQTLNIQLTGKVFPYIQGVSQMGAIERDGYIFEVEFSQISKKAAIHVTKSGQFVSELTLPFKGIEPTQEQIEEKIEQYLEMLTPHNREGFSY